MSQLTTRERKSYKCICYKEQKSKGLTLAKKKKKKSKGLTY